MQVNKYLDKNKEITSLKIFIDFFLTHTVETPLEVIDVADNNAPTYTSK